MSLSLTPGFSHSFSIFQNDVSPMALEIFRHSSSSGVLTTRAPDIAGQALDHVAARRARTPPPPTGRRCRSRSRSFSTPFSLSTSTIDCDHLVGHHLLGRLRPLPGDRRPDVAVQPGRVDLRALEVGAGGLEQDRVAAARQHAVADEDVVLPVALEDAGDVADVLADEADERRRGRASPSSSARARAGRDAAGRSRHAPASRWRWCCTTRRGSCSCGLPRKERSIPLPVGVTVWSVTRGSCVGRQAEPLIVA